MKHLFWLTLIIAFCGCKSDTKQNMNPLTASAIVDKAIEVSGGKRINNSTITFNFRDKAYKAERSNGHFKFYRLQFKNGDTIIDSIDNSGYERLINGVSTEVVDTLVSNYSASVNSVHYFSVLPYGLNDKAVNKFFLDEEQVKGKIYYKIKVTFDEVGGGEDFEDIFVYWIDVETFMVDYLAYSYNEADDIGMRFREAYNERFIKGIRFVDYNNFKNTDDSILLFDLSKAFNEDKLKLLSKIELKNIEVNLIDMQ